MYYSPLKSVKDYITENKLGLSARTVTDKVNLETFLDYNTQMGNPTRVLTDHLKFLNTALQQGTAGHQQNQDFKSLTFFTRPQLNLQSRQLLQDRKMGNLLNSRSNSMSRYIRMMLDPRLGAIGDDTDGLLGSDLIDNNNVFIPFATNSYKSNSGWPDTVAPTKSTTPGRLKEEFAYIDGVTDMYHKFDLDVVFRNSQEEPAQQLFDTWIRNASLTFQGKMFPYYDMIKANEMDYATRIYKLILTPDGKFVKKIASTGASFPVAISDGAVFNDSDANNRLEKTGDDFTVRFVSMGAIYNDPITLMNFNLAVGYFHPGMQMLNDGRRGHGMMQIDNDVKGLVFKQRYPRINLFTLELEWYIEQDLFEEAVRNGQL